MRLVVDALGRLPSPSLHFGKIEDSVEGLVVFIRNKIIGIWVL